MKKYLFMAAAALLTLTTGCEDFLDTESYTKKNSGNFPTSAEDASNMVTGVYATLNLVSTDYSSSNFFVSELASDDRFGGGGGFRGGGGRFGGGGASGCPEIYAGKACFFG